MKKLLNPLRRPIALKSSKIAKTSIDNVLIPNSSSKNNLEKIKEKPYQMNNQLSNIF